MPQTITAPVRFLSLPGRDKERRRAGWQSCLARSPRPRSRCANTVVLRYLFAPVAHLSVYSRYDSALTASGFFCQGVRRPHGPHICGTSPSTILCSTVLYRYLIPSPTIWCNLEHTPVLFGDQLLQSCFSHATPFLLEPL